MDLDSLRWGVIAKMDKKEAMAPLAEYTRQVLVTGVALTVVACLLALVMATSLTRPIAALVKAARRVSQGTLDVQVDVAPDDEYRELGEAFNEMVRSLRSSREDLDRQVQENERLLQSLLPASAAAQVRGGTSETPQSFADVTVALINLVGLDGLAIELGEDRAMGLLSDIVGALDEAAEHHGVEKVRTIGASYLAASGLSLERPDHTARMVEFAREAVRIVRRFNSERQTNLAAQIRINAGPVIGGLIGRRKFIYDLWGDTVRLTRRMASDEQTPIVVTKAGLRPRARARAVRRAHERRGPGRRRRSAVPRARRRDGARMNELLDLTRDRAAWAAALALGLPLALVVATEVGFALARRGHAGHGLGAPVPQLGAAGDRRRRLPAAGAAAARRTTSGCASSRRPRGSGW